MRKFFAAISAVVLTFALTGCSTGGLTKGNENSFVSGSGSATLVKPADRKFAPELIGSLLDGTKIKVPFGQVIVLNVWASWCSPCRAEAPLLEDFATKLAGKVQFLGINTRDNVSSANGFINRFKITYPTIVGDALLADFRGSLLPNAIPSTLIIDSYGRVAVRISGEVTFATLNHYINVVSGESY
jgi:thiol-disulfide isomerase/thioredoxin